MQKNKNLIKAINRNVRSSSRKINNILKNIRGKKADVAIKDLSFARQRIAFDIKKDSVFITTEDPESSSRAKEEVIAEYDGEEIKIGYNGEYLKDIINHFNEETVLIKLNTPISATIFVSNNKDEKDEKTMLLMPVRLNNWKTKKKIIFNGNRNNNVDFF